MAASRVDSVRVESPLGRGRASEGCFGRPEDQARFLTSLDRFAAYLKAGVS